MTNEVAASDRAVSGMTEVAAGRRRSIRLAGYDYTQCGAYFVTICTQGHQSLFGAVVDGVMRLNAVGEVVREEWVGTGQLRDNVETYGDELVVMPNHVHSIVWIVDEPEDGEVGPDVGAQRRCAPCMIGCRHFRMAVELIRHGRSCAPWSTETVA